MTPLLICEAGLHGDGDGDYYVNMIEDITRYWSGWPKLVFKMQHWTDGNPWAEHIRATVGRYPLACVRNSSDMFRIQRDCDRAGIIFATTPHDLPALHFVKDYVRMIKLGTYDATDPDLVDAARGTKLPLIINNSAAPFIVGSERFIAGVPSYPANAEWESKPSYGPNGVIEGGIGYSCHSVPALIPGHVLEAAKRGCRTIEVHVTNRRKELRPLPADMCVSLSVREFLDLAEGLGSIWNARKD